MADEHTSSARRPNTRSSSGAIAATGPAAEAASLIAMRRWCIKWTAVSGMLQMLACCLWGLARDSPLNHWDRMFVGSHHQFAHNGELLLACALLFVFVRLPRPALVAAFWTFQVGTWTNPIAYMIMSASGESMPFDVEHGGKERPTGMWGAVAQNILVNMCAPTMVISVTLLLVGLLRERDYIQSLRSFLGLNGNIKAQ